MYLLLIINIRKEEDRKEKERRKEKKKRKKKENNYTPPNGCKCLCIGCGVIEVTRLAVAFAAVGLFAAVNACEEGQYIKGR
mgnify:CR=1 FL=1